MSGQIFFGVVLKERPAYQLWEKGKKCRSTKVDRRTISGGWAGPFLGVRTDIWLDGLDRKKMNPPPNPAIPPSLTGHLVSAPIQFGKKVTTPSCAPLFPLLSNVDTESGEKV